MGPDLRRGRAAAANEARGPSGWARERSVPIFETMQRVPGYPSKLVVYRIKASKYWQVLCWVEGRTRKRSAKTTALPAAIAMARVFYERWLVEAAAWRRVHVRTAAEVQATLHLALPSANVPQAPVPHIPSFALVAAQLIANESARVQRGEWSRGSLQVLHNRLERHLFPRFGSTLCRDITFQTLQGLVNELSVEHSTTTINQYLVVVRKVLKQALGMG